MFNTCLRHIFEVEGGYSDHEEDRGGKTQYGITEKTYLHWVQSQKTTVPFKELKNIDHATAEKIYREMYWDKIKADELPPGLNLMVFDHAVHAGPATAIRHLQFAIGAQADGIIGPQTLSMCYEIEINSEKITQALEKIAVGRIYIAKDNSTFALGWFNRITRTLVESLSLLHSKVG